MADKKFTHFWEGKDSTGRELRCSLATQHERGLAIVVPMKTALPALVFRAKQEWRHEAGWVELRRQSVADTNRRRMRKWEQGQRGPSTRLLPEPRTSGTVFVFVLAVSLREFERLESMGVALGLERKFRPSMARLSRDDMACIRVALDLWNASGGEQALHAARAS